MILILFGPPGAGKGTQSDLLKSRFNYDHLSTGDMFREHLTKNTELGQKAKSFIDRGALVPDEVVDGMVIDALTKRGLPGHSDSRILLDGYPRNVNQAQVLGKFLGKTLPLIVSLKVADAVVADRLGRRRTCSNKSCKHIFSESDPSKNGICPKCKSDGTIRSDDRQDAIIARLKVFHNETSSVIEAARSLGWPNKEVAGTGEEEEVFRRLQVAIGL